MFGKSTQLWLVYPIDVDVATLIRFHKLVGKPMAGELRTGHIARAEYDVSGPKEAEKLGRKILAEGVPGIYARIVTLDKNQEVVKDQVLAQTNPISLQVPKHFSMFTKRGNAFLEGYAKKALLAMEKVSSKAQAQEVLRDFLVKWVKLSSKKGCHEAGDTAVREVVGNFHDELAKASGHWEDWHLIDLWEKNRDAAYRKAREV
jgi:hypothetical protein